MEVCWSPAVLLGWVGCQVVLQVGWHQNPSVHDVDVVGLILLLLAQRSRYRPCILLRV